MSAWVVERSYAARAALLSMPWRDAAAVDAATLVYIETGQGDAYLIGGDKRRVILRVGRYRTRLQISFTDRSVFVVYIVRVDG